MKRKLEHDEKIIRKCAAPALLERLIIELTLPVPVLELVVRLTGVETQLDDALALLVCAFDPATIAYPATKNWTHFRNPRLNAMVREPSPDEHRLSFQRFLQKQQRDATASIKLMVAVGNTLQTLNEYGYRVAQLAVDILSVACNHLPWWWLLTTVTPQRVLNRKDGYSLREWTETLALELGTCAPSPVVQFLQSLLDRDVTLRSDTYKTQHARLFRAMKAGSRAAFAFVSDRLFWYRPGVPAGNLSILRSAAALRLPNACAQLASRYSLMHMAVPMHRPQYWMNRCVEANPIVAQIYGFRKIEDEDEHEREQDLKDQQMLRDHPEVWFENAAGTLEKAWNAMYLHENALRLVPCGSDDLIEIE